MLGLLLAVNVIAAGAAPPLSAEERALSYLAREVPRWKKENGCYSCHNNGDAVRVLYAAVRLRRTVPPAALADTTRWLMRPAGWDDNGGKGPFSDRRLARLQFAAALAEAHAAGGAKDARALETAAGLVIGEQAKDGSWQVLRPGTLGGPTTHGTALATALAVGTLRKARRDAVSRGDCKGREEWLRKTPPDGVLDAGAVLLALSKAGDSAAAAQRRRCLEQIRKGEARGGGWGPYDFGSAHAGGVRYGGRIACAGAAGANGRDCGMAEARPGVSAGGPAERRQLDGDHAPGGGGELCAAALDHGMGDSGAAGAGEVNIARTSASSVSWRGACLARR